MVKISLQFCYDNHSLWCPSLSSHSNFHNKKMPAPPLVHYSCNSPPTNTFMEYKLYSCTTAWQLICWGLWVVKLYLAHVLCIWFLKSGKLVNYSPFLYNFHSYCSTLLPQVLFIFLVFITPISSDKKTWISHSHAFKEFFRKKIQLKVNSSANICLFPWNLS